MLATCDIRSPNEAFENTFPCLSHLACNGYLAHLFENLQLRLPHPSLSLPHGTLRRKKQRSSTHRFRITASLIREKQALPYRTRSGKPCGRCVRDVQKLPSPTTVTHGCTSTTYGIAEHVFIQLGYPLVVMVETSQDRNCHHLVPHGERNQKVHMTQDPAEYLDAVVPG